MKQACSLLMTAAACLAAGSALAQSEVSVPGEMRYAADAPPVAAESWRDPMLAKSALPALTLLPLTEERIESVHSYNQAPGIKALQIGIERSVRSETASSPLADGLQWHAVHGGHVAQVEIVSPGAEGLRSALVLDSLPDEAEIRVAGSTFPDEIYAETVAVARGLLDGNGHFWTALTDGERQRLELFVPDAAAHDPEQAVLNLAAVSHLLVPMNGSADMSKSLGASGSCHINVACRANLGEAFRITKNAVAHMSFQKPGGTYICTGTLLSDRDTSTQRKWFYSAHHCISSQTVANTLSTFWHYESATCNTLSAGLNRQMTGGATLRWSSAGTDALLLELNGSFPGGIDIGFAGWNAGAITGSGSTAVAAMHHPRGDNKKYSRGVFEGLQSATIDGQTVSNANRVRWTEGSTEGGSSGGGLFTWDAQGYYLRGGLFGGSASCANSGGSLGNGNLDLYSRFDLVFPNIQQYINVEGGGSTGAPTRDHSGAWYVPSESGWGLLLQQYGGLTPQTVLFATWFTFDQQGRRAWYRLLPSWTGSNIASGRVERPSGPVWATSFNPNQVTFADAGSFTLTFTSATRATFTFNVDGVQRTVTLDKL